MNVIIKDFMETFRKINTNYKYSAKIYIKYNILSRVSEFSLKY